MELQLPPHEGVELSVVDMHTGGEPLRIIVAGYPEVRGDSVLSKRRYAREHLDHLRKVLMFEPRGHYDMYGALIVDSEMPEADLGVLFMHNEGYSTMCGHAVIALGRFAVDYKLVKEPQSPETQRFGLDVKQSRTRDLVDAAMALTRAIKSQVKLHHPVSDDLAFLYGTILTDGRDQFSPEPTANICVFAEAQVDRSPTGSGVTARVALQYHKGLIQLNQTRTFQSGATGSQFTGKAVEEIRCGDFRAVVVEVAGRAFYTGVSRFVQEPQDELTHGFLLK
ncbi:trans-L-3-hydroxyproline dehydratase isoform X2 [Xiphophorus couchianus]|uniref:trans-L-3-hydroxyproline dehydratase isoform X2 n=1 Tax=Xiphophorus couchianus TaxID=32473 RepID=UPI0010160B4B|nr:trans-3-hydroxy-L-proline dehydratase isoform X2 [Xiphophorus couchianus]